MRLQTAWQVSIIVFARYEVRRADLINAEPEPLGSLAPARVAVSQGEVQ